MTASEQFDLSPGGSYELRAALHGSKMSAGAVYQVREVFGTEGGHRMVFEVSPDASDRIALGCIRGQLLQSDGAALGLDVWPAADSADTTFSLIF